jgi:hypothetical protein
MTISAPATPFSQLNQPAVKFEIRIGDETGAFPDSKGVMPDFYPIMSARTANGRRDDTFVLAVKTPGRIVDADLKKYLGRQVEVWAFDDEGKPTNLISWGFICGKPVRIDDSQEIYGFEARIGDEHFEDPLEKYPTWDTTNTEEVELEVMRPLFFNPEIDGLIEPNKSSKTNAQEWSYVLDPESVRTSTSKTFQEQTASLWKLSEAVLSLCWWLNPSQTWIKNPTLKDVKAAFLVRDDLLKNVYIPIGTTLPDALDILLGPMEYGWCLVHGTDKDGLRETKFRFFQRGQGSGKSLFMQRRAEPEQSATVRDIRKTSVLSFDALVSNAGLANRVICYGKYKEREGTFTLKPGWLESFDTKPLSDMKEGATFATDHPEVGRKFIFDTAGDYIGYRAEMLKPVDLTNLFGDDKCLVVRRRFTKCLTEHVDADDSESNGFYVEWWNKNVPTSVSWSFKDDPGWTKIRWPFSVLEKEAGIFFTGDTPPPQLWRFFYENKYSDFHLRITATLTGDYRVKGEAVRRASSSNKQDVTLALDVSDKFQDSRVDTSEQFKSKFRNKPTDARNDTAAILTYAQQIRNVEDCLRLDTSIPLEGALHPEYQIGDVIRTIAGRNVDLQLADGRYPQVVGIIHHFQEQQVELLLESFRKERPRVVIEDKQATVVSNVNRNIRNSHFRMKG